MKYTIHGFQQKKLIEGGLDNDDALILSVFKEMYCSASIETKIIENEKYIWVNQQSLVLNQLPILGSRAKIMRKLKSLEEKGYIKRKLLFSKNGVKGKYSYLTITARLEYLSEYTLSQNETTPCIKTRLPLYQNETTLVSKRDNKDSPIIDSSIIDYIYIHFNSKKIICSRNITEKIIKAIRNALKNYSEEEIIKAIDNYNTVINDSDYFFDTKWGIENFLKQSNGLAHFVDDGEKWINYINSKNKTKTKNNDEVGKFNKQVSGFREKNYDYDALQRELLGWDD